MLEKLTVDQVKKRLNMKEDKELQQLLGYKSSGVISGWRKKGEIPAKAMFEIQKIIEKKKSPETLAGWSLLSIFLAFISPP